MTEEQKTDPKQQAQQGNPNKKSSTNKSKNKKSTAQKWIDALNTAGTISGAIAKIGLPVANLALSVAKVIKAFRTNDKSWYTRYGSITPARNENRPMDSVFNKSITSNATMGGMCKHVDVNVNWTGYSSTFMFDQVIRSSYQTLRMNLRSNLPYTANALKAYMVNAIGIAIIAKQLERDVQWNMFSDPKDRNFNKMWKLTNPTTSYGSVELSPISYLSTDAVDGYSEWANTIAQYDVFASVYNSAIQLPEYLGRFISHYFGSVFTDSADDYNDQFIRLMIGSVDWAIYDKATDSITYSTISLSSIGLDKLIDITNDLSLNSGMITADLLKSNQLSSSVISKFGNYVYEKVYDPGFLQALINAYTDASAVTQFGYVRMDRMFGVEDDLTQFVFMGGLQTWSGYTTSNATDKIEVPAIRVVNMTLKFDSDSDIAWPAGLFQNGTNQTLVSSVIKEAPFGISIRTEMSSDVRVQASILGNTIPWYFDESPVPLVNSATFSWNTDASPSSLVREINITGGFADNSVHLFLPVFNYEYKAYSTDVEFKYVRWFAEFTARIDTSSSRNFQFTYSTLHKVSGSYTVNPSGKKPYKNYAWLTCANGPVYDTKNWVSTKVFVDPNNCVNLGWGDTTEQFNLLGVMSDPSKENSQLTWMNAFNFVLVNVSNHLEYGLRIAPQSANTQLTFTKALPYEGRPNDISIIDSPITSLGEWLLEGTYSISTILLTPVNQEPNKVAIYNGMTLLAPYVADSFDYHIPMFVKANASVDIYSSDDVEIHQSLATSPMLIKECYIPYYYNILDLVPVLYSMFTSLFAPNSESRTRDNKSDTKYGDRK